jgi:phenylalanine-4-hydroxylase
MSDKDTTSELLRADKSPGAGITSGANRPAWESIDNPNVKRLPNHLKQFIVDQVYDQYTPVDHAVWRFIMRTSLHYLRENAHRLYFKGLLETGINLERIPRIQEMNDILSAIGWGAVAVDGFIPPAAFMEFQAYKVLVIACDMRQIDHVEYTPAPDIVHEAAGHAPIIVDQDYAEYLRRFGEIGAKAMSSRKDFELYQAIRHLSIIKEAPGTDSADIRKAEEQVKYMFANLGTPSEMALLSRLHWWTVEYGLIGDLSLPKIYGAGLLSSIGESMSCLGDNVKKLPYAAATAKDFPFDITTQQPQLFVVDEFPNLMRELETFASTMAFTVGGRFGIESAIECCNVATAVYSSGLQVTGVFTELVCDAYSNPAYLRTVGPSDLCYDNKEIHGHDKKYHREGFGSPVGKLKGNSIPFELMDDKAIANLGIAVGEDTTLSFESGVTVSGCVSSVTRRDRKLILISFSNCVVTHGKRVLFKPEWGAYDMAVGENIVSVFCGAADKDAYDQVALIPKERTIKIHYDDKTRRVWPLYQQVRDCREGRTGHSAIPDIWRTIQMEYPGDWLLPTEIYELCVNQHLHPEIAAEIKQYLLTMKKRRSDLVKLISDGIMLAEHPPQKPDPKFV